MKKSSLVPLLFIVFSFFLSACVSVARHKTHNSKFPGYEQDSTVMEIERVMMNAAVMQREGKVQPVRDLCDRALTLLIKNKDKIEAAEYERLHSDAAFLRIKVSHERDSILRTVESDLFPLVWNSRVEKWINYFTGRGRESFTRMLERSAYYTGSIIEALEEKNMPLDLIALPIIESGYNPFATSRVGAVGLWQFMEATGKQMGLRIDDWVDERRDPHKSTSAALKMLSQLHERFGSWELALAAYNHGPAAVARRVRQWETNDYWELFLPRETEEFVPKIMAAIFIIREPELFGFEPLSSNPYRYREFRVTDALDLRQVAEWTASDIKEIQSLNPELKQICTPPGKEYSLKIPETGYKMFSTHYFASEEKYLTSKEIERRVRKVIYHRVSSGDTLWSISRRYNVSISNLKSWNNLRTDLIRPRQQIKIYRRGG